MAQNKIKAPLYGSKIVLMAAAAIVCPGCVSVKPTVPEIEPIHSYHLPEIHKRTHEQLLRNQSKLMNLEAQNE